MSQELTKKQQDAINEVETALKKLYDAGLVLITQNGNALFYKADSYNDAVKEEHEKVFYKMCRH